MVAGRTTRAEVFDTSSSKAEVYRRAGDLLRVLTAPQRMAIVVALADGPRRRQELEEIIDVPRQTAEYHLRALRAAGVVHAVRRGREVVYSRADEHAVRIVTGAIACVAPSL